MTSMTNKKFPEANYREDIAEIYKGNVLIQALPEEHSEDSIVETLLKDALPEYSDFQLPPHQRAHSIGKLKMFFHPFEIHIKYALNIDHMIRHGYLARNPRYRYFAKSNEYKNSQVENIFLTGPSGIGKSSTTLNILNYYEQVIAHPKSDLTQVVWLKLECPVDGSLKTLCASFFDQMEQLLGSVKIPNYNRMSLTRYVTEMANVAKRFNLGVLIIDEIQRSFNNRRIRDEKILDFLVQLNNEIKLPVIVLGMPNSEKITNTALAYGRRFPLTTWGVLENNEEYSYFLERLWDCSWLKEQPQLTDDFVNTFYNETQGITDLVVKLYAALQYKGVYNSTETFSLEDVSEVAKKIFKGLAKVLNAMRNNDYSTMASFEDLPHLQFEDISNLFAVNNVNARIKQITSKNKHKTKKCEVLHILLQTKIPEQYADNFITNELRRNKDAEVDEIVRKCLTAYDRAKKQAVKASIPAITNTLPEYINKCSENDDVYDYMKNDGLIKPPTDEFKL